MTQQEIQDRNKEIALMLNYMHNIRFDKDWNWLMEVKEAIYRYNLYYLVFN